MPLNSKGVLLKVAAGIYRVDSVLLKLGFCKGKP